MSSTAPFTFEYTNKNTKKSSQITVYATSRAKAFEELERKNRNWDIKWN
jgi:hypothetical protein